MVFSQLAFLYCFFPAVMIIYWLIKDIRIRNVFILLTGLIFYSWGEPFYVCIMLLSTAIDYFAGRYMDKFDKEDKKRKICLLVSVCMNIGLLCIFKYSDFFTDSLSALLNTQLHNPVLSVNRAINGILPLKLDEKRVHLPIGISFFTFQSMSYTIDLYRRRIKVQKSFIRFAAYVTLFPQIVAGPIVRYEQVEKELSYRTVTSEKVFSGLAMFIKGLSKKVLIANNVGLLASQVWGMELSSLPALTAWLGALAFTLQIYFDFSGYSDMAVGMGKMMGFEFPKNFDHPYLSQSVSEFWRRWHITLGDWFREYVYIPLGGNRKGKGRTLINLFIVWALTGLWHGAQWNFVVWGLYFGVFIIIEKIGFSEVLKKIPAVLRVIYSLFIVIIGWVFFNSPDLPSSLGFLASMFTMKNGFADSMSMYLLSENIIMLMIGAVLSTGVIYRLKKFVPRSENVRTALLTAAEISAVALCTAYIVRAIYNPFLYFRF
ncbi:MAG: MBOAT family protein [Oscillospiraceae bacterium]|nr:MBOAT family protein [Oscillospiraceae bacterium]